MTNFLQSMIIPAGQHPFRIERAGTHDQQQKTKAGATFPVRKVVINGTFFIKGAEVPGGIWLREKKDAKLIQALIAATLGKTEAEVAEQAPHDPELVKKFSIDDWQKWEGVGKVILVNVDTETEENPESPNRGKTYNRWKGFSPYTEPNISDEQVNALKSEYEAAFGLDVMSEESAKAAAWKAYAPVLFGRLGHKVAKFADLKVSEFETARAAIKLATDVE